MSQAEDAMDQAVSTTQENSPVSPSGASAADPPHSSKKRRLSDTFDAEAATSASMGVFTSSTYRTNSSCFELTNYVMAYDLI
jgi:hypothetical protein